MSFLDRIKSLFSGGSQRDDERGHPHLQSPTHPPPDAREPTEAELQAAAAAAPPVTPVGAHTESTVPPADVPPYEGLEGSDESEPLDESRDPAP